MSGAANEKPKNMPNEPPREPMKLVVVITGISSLISLIIDHKINETVEDNGLIGR